jgi:hypothetical protein
MASIGTGQKQYYSLINFLDTREILKSIVDIENDTGFAEIFMPSRYFVTKQYLYHHFVNESLFKIFDTTGNTVTGTGTATITATGTVATSGYVRKGATIYFPTGAAVGYVTNVTTASSKDTLTIVSVDGSNITSAAGDKYGVSGLTVGEKSINPTNVRFGLTGYYNYLQIFREVNEMTDVQNASTVEVEFEGKPYIVYKDLWEKLVLLKGTVNAAFFAGRQSQSSFGEATFLSPLDPYTTTFPTSFTQGLYQYIANYGKTTTVATTGTFAPAADQQTITQNLLAAKSPKSILMYVGSLASGVIDTGLKNLGSSGVTSVRLIIDGKDVDMEVDKWSYAGFNFRKVVMGILDSQEQFVNTVYPKYGYCVPDGKAKVEGGDGYVPRLSVRYFRSQVARNQGDDIWEEWHTGALAPTGATSDEKLWRANFDTIQGLEGLGMAQSLAIRILT